MNLPIPNPFKVEVEAGSSDPIHIIRVSGELRRGRYLDNDVSWKPYINNAKNIARTKLVIFDLVDLTYWDTRGIAEVVGTVISINKDHPMRCGIIAPKDSHMYVLAKTKYVEIGTDKVPWKNTKEELLKFMGQ